MSSSASHEVAVVGCGLMGAALARALARAGLAVAAWNRTPEKAEALADAGVVPVRSIDDLVRSAAVVVVCTSTYDAAREALEPVGGWDDVALVNLSTGGPDDAQDMADWAAARGASYLDGVILGLPEQIGTEAALIPLSGSAAAWTAHGPMLASLGPGVRHISDLVSAAAVLGVAGGAFYTCAIGAYVEAIAYAQRQGVAPSALLDVSASLLETLAVTTAEAAAAIESGNHATEQATLATYAEGMRDLHAAMRQAGERALILGATVANLERAEAAGLGELGISAQVEVV